MALTEDRSALDMNELTATVTSIIAPYAATQLHAALYSYQYANGRFSFGLEAFSRDRTRPRGEIMMVGFGGPFTRQEDKKAAQARAWRLRTRGDLLDVIVQGVTWEQRAYFLVFWHDDAYFPPARAEVPTEAAAAIPDTETLLSARMRLTAALSDAPISFIKCINVEKDGYQFTYVAKDVVPGIVDSALHYIGEMLPKEEEATPAAK